MRIGLNFLVLLFLLSMPKVGFCSEIFDGLSSADAAKVKAGQQILITENLPDYPWPKARIFQTSSLKPEEIMAVFFDYNNAFRYVPNCLVSKISKKISPTIFDVEYEVSVPILPDESYTAQNTLRRLAGGGFLVSWEVMKASSIESSVGNLRVEPFGKGSVLCYSNLVKPASKAAGLLRSLALSQMKNTVGAILKEAAAQKSEAGNVMAAKIAIMEAALDKSPNAVSP